MRSWDVVSGRFFSQTETDEAAKVAVLGQTVVAQLFPDGSDPDRPDRARCKNVPFTVIGTLIAKGQSGVGQDQDDTVLIPYTSALERLTGGTTHRHADGLGGRRPSTSTSVQTQITGLLEQRHGIVGGQADDFQVRNLQDIAQAASATASILGLLLAAVAAVSLLVGGIGIMNIMLVSVTERTREIGLRVALGARGAAILRQFLIEAVVLSTGGGALGVVLGVAGAAAIAVVRALAGERRRSRRSCSRSRSAPRSACSSATGRRAKPPRSTRSARCASSRAGPISALAVHGGEGAERSRRRRCGCRPAARCR